MICPLVGCSNPAIRRKQVVLPDPDGPSMEKNSPSAMASVMPETALTCPKLRLTSSSSIAYVTLAASPAKRRRARFVARAHGQTSTASHDGDVVRDPTTIGHALGSAT